MGEMIDLVSTPVWYFGRVDESGLLCCSIVSVSMNLRMIAIFILITNLVDQHWVLQIIKRPPVGIM